MLSHLEMLKSTEKPSTEASTESCDIVIALLQLPHLLSGLIGFKSISYVGIQHSYEKLTPKPSNGTKRLRRNRKMASSGLQHLATPTK